MSGEGYNPSPIKREMCAKNGEKESFRGEAYEGGRVGRKTTKNRGGVPFYSSLSRWLISGKPMGFKQLLISQNMAGGTINNYLSVVKNNSPLAESAD